MSSRAMATRLMAVHASMTLAITRCMTRTNRPFNVPPPDRIQFATIMARFGRA